MEELIATLFLLFFFLTLFSILGVNLWSGKFRKKNFLLRNIFILFQIKFFFTDNLDGRCRLTEKPENGYWPVDLENPRLCNLDSSSSSGYSIIIIILNIFNILL